MKNKKIKALLLMAVMSCNFQFTAYADRAYISSEEGYHKQEKDLWCWLASAENATKLEKIGFYNQYETAKALKGSTKDVSGSLIDAVNAAEFMCYDTYSYTASYYIYTYETLKNYLNRSIPVIMGLNWLNENGKPEYGHMVVLIGYNDDYVNGVKQDKIYYYDPETGSVKPDSYSRIIETNSRKNYLYVYTVARVHRFK